MQTQTILTPEQAATVREVLERRIICDLTSLVDDGDFDHVITATRLAQVVVDSVGSGGYPKDDPALPAGEALHLLVTAARWEDELAEDALAEAYEPGREPEGFIAFNQRRGEAAREVLEMVGAARGNPSHLARVEEEQ